MAKESKTGKNAPVAEPVTMQAPSGYEDQTSDIIGFWDPDAGTPIHFIPREVKAMDSHIDPLKPSFLIIGTLVEDCTLAAPASSDEEEIDGKKGDLVGVWYKPGMKAIIDLGGVAVFMYHDCDVDIGKPSPMKHFRVLSKLKGTKIPLTDDMRDKSKGVKSIAKEVASAAPPATDNAPDTDIPF